MVKIQAFIQGTADAIRPKKEEPKKEGEAVNDSSAARELALARARSIRRRNEGLPFISTQRPFLICCCIPGRMVLAR